MRYDGIAVRVAFVYRTKAFSLQAEARACGGVHVGVVHGTINNVSLRNAQVEVWDPAHEYSAPYSFRVPALTYSRVR